MSEENRKGSVIVVDDDSSVRELVTRALQREGYEITTAANGSEASHATARKKFDLMFLDINMPGLNGLDVLTIMAVGNPGIPIVMLTAVDDPDAETEAFKRGAAAYLKKPCKMIDVIRTANSVINGKSMAEEMPS
ncbi:MAG: response regulator [Chloroflexi bacterium]|jgi:DNA-binding NtrC family response regulator|nr:response regulator [Chloroflexota bacterium]